MLRKFVCAAIVVVFGLSIAMADEIQVLISKADGGKITYKKVTVGKGGKGGKGGGGFGGAGGANAEKLAAIDKEAADKVDLVLTADQRRAFKSMVGDEFKLEQKGFGGGGKGKGKKGAGAE